MGNAAFVTCNAAIKDVFDEASYSYWSDEEASSVVGSEMPILPKVPMPCSLSCGCRGNSVLGATESQTAEINLVRSREPPASSRGSRVASPRKIHRQIDEPSPGTSSEASPSKFMCSPRYNDGTPRFDTGLALFLRASATSAVASPKIPEGFQSQICIETGKQVLLHKQSDIVVLDAPLRSPRIEAGCVTDDPSGDVLLFHYTHSEAFREILRSPSPWECLENVCNMKICTSNGEGTNCGQGIYCTFVEPAQFGTQHAVLLNNCTNRTDLEGQLRFIAACRKDAEFCVPLLVPRCQVTNVQLESTPEMVHGAGRNVSGESLRKDRDIWVVAMTLQKSPSSSTRASVEDDGDRLRPSTGKGGQRRSTEGLHVSFAADTEEWWYRRGEGGPWEWLELCMPWLCLCALSLLRPSSSQGRVSTKRHV